MTITVKDLNQASKEYYVALDRWEEARTKWKTILRDASKEVVQTYYNIGRWKDAKSKD